MNHTTVTLHKINSWLQSDEKDLRAGAELLLTLNGNRILYRSILNRKNIDKLLYEMNRQKAIYESRLTAKGVSVKTPQETAKLENRVAIISEHLEEQDIESKKKGKRTDHDQLSDEVKQAYEDNTGIYQRMRSAHEKLKLLETPCDREPIIKELIQLDDTLRENWTLYDTAIIGQQADIKPTAAEPLTAQQVSNARRYLSGNKQKLADLKAGDDPIKYAELRDKMQERLTSLLLDNQGIDEAHLNDFIGLGLTKPERKDESAEQ